MEITAELTELESWRRRLAVVVPESVVAEAFQETTTAYAAQAEMPGFRKGKVPLNMVKTRHGEAIRQDVLQDLLPRSYEQAIRQHSLVPIGDPEVSDVEFKEGQQLTYTVEIDVRPQIEITGYKGLSLTRTKYDVADSDVNQAIDSVRRARSDVVAVTRPAEMEDVVTVDLQKIHDRHNKVKEGKIADLPIELGEGCRPEFLQHIPGMRVGEGREIEVTYDAEERDPDLAGNVVLYRVWMKSVGTRVLPDLNDEFAATVGPFENVEQFRTAVREDLDSRARRHSDEDLRSQARKAIVEANPFEVPKHMVDNYIQGVLGRMRESNPEATEESIRSVFEPMAIEQFRWDYIIMELARTAELKVPKEEVDLAREHIARQQAAGADKGEMPSNEQIANRLIEHKVLEFLVDGAEIAVREQPLTPRVIAPGAAQ